MPDYKNGKIYKIEPICDHEENEIYIGSTTKQYLTQRMDLHRYNYKQWQNGKFSNISSFQLFEKYGIENCQILLLECYPCETRNELHSREGYYMKLNKCVNKLVAGRTKNEYKQDNKAIIEIKDKIYRKAHLNHKKQYDKEYRKNNGEKINEKYKCECGGTYILRKGKAGHLRTNKHREYIRTEALKQCLSNMCSFEETKQIYNKL